MGEVYRATDTHLRRTVALKLLPERFVAEPERLSRFEEEARAASALNHPNIVTIYDSGVSDGTPWIAMEYVEGRTLRRLAQEEAPGAGAVLRIARQIADALAKAHESGIVHRDLKPENVIVGDNGCVKILDFGAAKLTREHHTAGGPRDSVTEYITAPGAVVGTPEYMSPEQVKGQPTDYRSDQFALGAILYELLSEEHPFRRESVAETWSAILHAEPARLNEIRPGLSLEIAGVVARCLAKDPAHRFASTLELARALESAQAVSRGSHTSGNSAHVAAQVEPRRRSRIWRMLRIAAVVIPALAAAGIWLDGWVKKQAQFYQLQLQANALASNWEENEIRKGIELYQRALTLKPKSAEAHAGLAGAWIVLSDLNVSPREAMPKAADEALKAAQLDNGLPNAHVNLGLVKLQYEWDWAAAEQEFKRAVELDRKEIYTREMYGWYLAAAGRFYEAEAEVNTVLRVNPSDDFGLWTLGLCYHMSRQFDRAVEQYRRAIGVLPRLYWPHMLLAWSLEQQGKFDDAITEAKEALRLTDNPQVAASLAHAYAVSGRRADAERALADLLELSKRRYVSPYDIAAVYAGLGDREQTLAWLEKAYQDRSGWLPLWLYSDPRFDLVRSDARFRDLLQRIGRPV